MQVSGAVQTEREVLACGLVVQSVGIVVVERESQRGQVCESGRDGGDQGPVLGEEFEG